MKDHSTEFPSFSLDRYRILVEEALDVIYEADDEGYFTFVNARAEEVLGYQRSELLSKKYTQFIHPDYVERTQNFYKDQFKEKKQSTYLEFPALTKSGQTIWLGQHVQLLYSGEKIRGTMAVARIITDKYLANDILKQSEEKYRSIIQNLQFGLIEVDLDERITFINDAMCEITGYSREELIGQVASKVLTDEEMRRKIAVQHSLRDQNQSSVYEAEILKKDGKKLYALISGAPSYDSLQRRIGSIGIHVDISERKEKELELQENQRFLSAINSFVTHLLDIDDIQGIAWEIAENVIEKFGFEDCVIYVWNEEKHCLEQMAAYGPKMQKGRKIKEPIQIKLGEGVVGSVAQSGQAQIIPNTSKDPRYIVDDQRRLSELSVPIKADNKVIGVIDSEHPDPNFFTQKHLDTLTTIANLAASRLKNAKAKRKQEKVEMELRDSETKLRQVIESALDAIITINEQGNILEWNPRAGEIFGWTPEEVISTSLTSNIIPSQHHKAHDAGMKRYLANGIGPVLNQRIELTAMRKGGEEFPIELTIIPIVRGGVHTFTAFIRDITMLKSTRDEMEKALSKERELNELKSRFVSMTSHEFRTPLTTIKQNVDLISFQLENQDPKAMEAFGRYFGRIDSEISRVTNLMNDILLLGKIEAGKVEIHTREINLEKLAIDAISKICTGRSDERTIHLKSIGVPRLVKLDPQLMEHMFSNLFSNALKYSPNSTKDPEVVLNFNKQSEVKISCKDYGIGIPKKDQKGLFSSFFRATNVKNIQGTGLGLSIIKEFVRLHNGTIDVNSDVNKGTEFIISLPSN
ncbi:PAS domain S-box protein [Algoriphagus namhaensis]|uniref:histidine kinase n=1 Tax=Algoriphagus namhaensis TaxID=915353 RepID=A0ABV8APR0_9BACT